MPRKKWRQLLAFLSCGGLGRTKKSKHNDSAVAVEGTRSRNDTISINFERQEGNARETEVSNSPHAGIEVERFQGREATAHSHVQTIEVHQQWPPGDAQADLLGSDMQMKTVRDRAGATKVDVSNEVTDMASGNATTPRALTWKDMQSVAESTHDNMDISADLQSLGDKSDGVDLTTMQGSEYPIAETQSDLEKPTMLHEKSISLSEDDGSIMPVPPQHSWQMLAKGTTSEDSVAEPGSDCEKPSSLPVQGRSGGNLLGRYIPGSGCGEPRFDDNVKYNIATKTPLAIDRFYKDDSILGLLGRTCHGLITYPVVEPNTGQAAGQLRYSRSLPSLSSLVNYNLPTDWSAGQSKPPFTASEANESVVTTRAVQCSPEDAQLEQERGEISAYTDPLESELQTLEIEKVPLSTELPNYIRPDVERLCDNTSRVNAVLPTNDFLNMTSRGTNKLGEVGFSTRNNIYNSSETKTFRTTTSATANSCNIAVSVACAAYATTSTTGTTACAANGATASSTDATTKTTASTVYDITGTTGSTDRSKSSTAKAQRFTKIANSNMTTATTCGLGTTCVAEGPDTTDVDNKSRTETGETRMTSSCCNSISDGSDKHLQTQTQGATADLAYENSQAANSSSGISEVDPVHPRNNEAIDNHSGTEKHEMSTATPICNHGIGRDVDTFEGGETAMTEHNDGSDRHLQTQTQAATADLPYENSQEANSSSDAQLEHGKEEVPAYTDPLGSECFPLEVEDVPPSAGLPNYIKPSRINALAPTNDFPNMTGHGTDKLGGVNLSTRKRIPNSSETDTFRATTSGTVTSCNIAASFACTTYATTSTTVTKACAADGTTASSTDATIRTTASAAYAITGITGSPDRSKNFTADAQAITEIATTRTTATTTCVANDTKSTTATSASATGATMSTKATTTCTLDATTRIVPTAANVTNVPIGTMIPSASATMEINTSVISLSTPNGTRGATTTPFNPEDVTIVSATNSAASTAIKAVKKVVPVQPTGDEECPDTTAVENNMRTETDGSDRRLQTQTQGATADLLYENSQAANSSSDAQPEHGKEEVPAYTDPLGSECPPLEVEDVPPSAGLLNYIKPSRMKSLAPTNDFLNMTGHDMDKLGRVGHSTENKSQNSSETDTFRATCTTSGSVTSCNIAASLACATNATTSTTVTTVCIADGTAASATDATRRTTARAAYAITCTTGSTDHSKNSTTEAQACTEIATTRTTATTTCATNDTKSTTASSASATDAITRMTAATTCALNDTTRIAPMTANVTNVPIGSKIPSASTMMEINNTIVPLSTTNATRDAKTTPFNAEDVITISTISSAASRAVKPVKKVLPLQPTSDEEGPDNIDVENNTGTETDGSDRHSHMQAQGAIADLTYENSQAANSSSAELLTRGRTWQQRSPKTRSKAAFHLEDESKQRSVNITSNETTFSLFASSNRRSISGEVGISFNPLFKQNPSGECQPVPGMSNSSIKRNTSVDGLPAERISSVTKPGNLMSTQGPSQHEGERDVRPKTSSRVAFHTTEPDRTRVNRKPLSNSTGASSSVGLEADDADQLLEYLSVDNTIQRSSPIPENLKQFITKKAQERGVQCAAIYQCPTHAEKLNIIGYKATSLEEFLPNMREKFPGFSFLLTDSDDARHVKEYGDKENILLETTMSLRDNRTDSFIEQERSTCGLILTGRLVKPHHKYNGQFAVVPAHLVLKSKGFCEQLVMLNGGKNIHQVRKEMRAESDLDQYLSHQYNTPCKRDMEDIPWFGYRHFMETPPDQPLPTSQTPRDQPLPTSQTPPDQPLPTPPWEEFTNDIALLQMKQHQPEETIQESISNANLRKFSSTISHMPNAFTEASFRGHDVPIGAIFPLRRVETLEEMGRRSVRVFVDMKKGYMVPCGDSIDPGAGKRAWTYSIQFVSEKIFRHGDCGLIVYVQDIRKPHKLYPFGLYIGKSTRHDKCCKRPVQTAVVLSQGIDDIAHNYRHLVRDLKPLSDHTDSRHVDGHNWVDNLSQIPTPTSTTSRCDGASAAAAPRADSGYTTNDVIPESTSCQPEGEEEDEQ